MTTLMIKVGQIPGKISEVAIESGSTVGDAMRLAGIQSDGASTLTLNGEPATAETPLRANGTVLVSKKIKGAI